MQVRINQVLSEFPGGIQTAANEVSWGNGDVVLTIADPNSPSALSIGGCATGAHCVFSASNLTGSMMTFNSCATQSVAPLGAAVRSIANARSSVAVRAYNDLGALGSVTANSWANTSWATTKVGC
ncbi:peptidase inhibitor family I36 protein [Agromyces hippuratus]|uniref:peptidase inhibitor family I36 protein n=2 Tax=Agromyces hippuratus TaxID=286438 RepID=UPI0015C74FB3